MNWTRPANLPYPNVWVTFEGKTKVGETKAQYWIQDITSEYYEEVLYHMATGFVRISPMCVYTNFAEDQESVAEYKEGWKKIFEQKLSLICLTKDENNVIKLVGSNLLARGYKGEERNIDGKYKGRAARAAGLALHHVYKNCVDVYEELKVDEYILAYGLYVLPEYRRDGIGYNLLKAREALCVGVGIPVTITTFTTVGGQTLAEKLGYENLFEIPYKDLEKINPLFKFPEIEHGETKTIRLMYNRYK